MSASDNYVFENSMVDDYDTSKFVNKQITAMQDQQGGNYSGNQIIFESSQLANGGRYVSYAESYFVIPVVIALKSSTDIIAANPSPFMCGLKSGYHHIIDTMQVEYNGVTVVQQTAFTNIYTHFKIMSSWSADAVAKYGPSIGFWKDDVTSFQYSVAAAAATGTGISNNRLTGSFPTLVSPNYIGQTINTGFLGRVRSTGYVNTAAPAASSLGGLSVFYISPQTTGMNFFTGQGLADARIYYWNILCKIRPKDLHDFFDKLPLIRGGYLRITLAVNTASFNLTTAAAGPTITIAAPGDITVRGRTNPVMIASAAATEPLNGPVVGGADGVFSVAMGIGSVSIAGSTINHQTLTSCRWYCPTYQFVPSYEEQYLTAYPSQTVIYEDISNFALTGVAAGGSFNYLVANGITNPKKLLVVPQINSAAANHAAIVLPEPFSPFSTSPATTMPLAAITNYNVDLSGTMVYQTNQNYDFSNFMDELSKCGLNGSQSNMLGSGLISEQDFAFGYRYYFTDLSRRLPQDDVYQKSILISGTNSTAKIMDLCCFVAFGRQIKIKTSDGTVLMD